MPIIKSHNIIEKVHLSSTGCFWKVIYKEYGCIIIFLKEKIVSLDRKKQCKKKKSPCWNAEITPLSICIYIPAQKNGSGKTIFCTDTS